jgi:hypothetical protein
MLAHMFRVNDQNHVVLSVRSRVKRNGRHRAICGQVIGADAIRLAPHHQVGRSAPITCPKCDRSFDGFVDTLDTDFSFKPEDDGTGRFQ